MFKKYTIAELRFNFCRVRTVKKQRRTLIERDALTPAQHVSFE